MCSAVNRMRHQLIMENNSVSALPIVVVKFTAVVVIIVGSVVSVIVKLSVCRHHASCLLILQLFFACCCSYLLAINCCCCCRFLPLQILAIQLLSFILITCCIHACKYKCAYVEMFAECKQMHASACTYITYAYTYQV